jgi:hypothetical protein
MSHTVTDKEVAELIRRVDDAASAFMAGDMRAYVGLVAPDHTRFSPGRIGLAAAAPSRRSASACHQTGAVRGNRQRGSLPCIVHCRGGAGFT